MYVKAFSVRLHHAAQWYCMKSTESTRVLSLEGGEVIEEAPRSMEDRCRNQGVWLIQSRSDI